MRFPGKLAPVSIDENSEGRNESPFCSVNISESMTHFQKADLSPADKTLNQLGDCAIHTHTRAQHSTHILSNHSQLCVGMTVMKLY